VRRSLSLLAIVLLGCSDANEPQVGELLRAREKWRQLALADYDFSYQHEWAECFSIDTWAVKVRGGKAVEVVRTTTPCFGNAAPTTVVEVDATRSMEWIFDLAFKELTESESVRFTFDAVLGYPTLIRVDQTLQAADDEFDVSVNLSLLGK
jgi:hypothetical protein